MKVDNVIRKCLGKNYGAFMYCPKCKRRLEFNKETQRYNCDDCAKEYYDNKAARVLDMVSR
jgi:NADH pyrophosphatase NudC (nudix superfamily)